ncbi:MAG: selenide, water dikinase SelD [Bacteroidetes bacterium]|nr:MAG: selenide, water dikinase SelD [Bacteroidota bacterium]
MSYKLTEYSHGAGCGCKLSPGVLSDILSGSEDQPFFEHLLVGHETKDDAAVVALDKDTAIVSTTDFFMPIVDDAFDFGAIAATNALSDIYAMGASPLVAIAILGWPIDRIPATEAGRLLAGGRSVCTRAGIPLAGGHSIDAPEPIFGLAVTGRVPLAQIKKNKDGQAGDLLYLTKPLGIGMVTTAQKKKLAAPEDLELAKASMLTLNQIGSELAQLPYLHALTDVTGFGLAGHLLEMCQAAHLSATLWFDQLPLFEFVPKYLELSCIPGGTRRNWKTYGQHLDVSAAPETAPLILADPQTSGGLLLSVDPARQQEFESWLQAKNLPLQPIGQLQHAENKPVIRVV